MDINPMLYGFVDGDNFVGIEPKKKTLIRVPICELCDKYRYYQINHKYEKSVAGIEQAIKDGTNNSVVGYRTNDIFYYVSLNEDDTINGLQYFNAPLQKWFKEKGVYKIFPIMSNYETTHEGLLEYRADLIKWNNELKSNNQTIHNTHKYNKDTKKSVSVTNAYETNINLFDYKNFNHLVMSCYARWRDADISYADIQRHEYVFLQSTNNGGLTYFNKAESNKPLECWGYDFSGFYPTILYDEDVNIRNKIPVGVGEIINITEVPNKFEFGIYRAKIYLDDCENWVVPFFKISNYNFYTHTDLNFIMECKKRGFGNFRIELMGQALIYKNTVTLHNVFKKLYHNLLDLKKKYPKNKILKTVMTSMWGNLCRYKTEKYTAETMPQNYYVAENMTDLIIELEDNINEYTHIIQSTNIKYGDDAVYELVDLYNPYENGGIARLKPFLISYGREKIGKAILRYGTENLLRVATDGLVYTVNMDDKIHNDTIKYHPIKEDKNTGVFVWENQNRKRKPTEEELLQFK